MAIDGINFLQVTQTGARNQRSTNVNPFEGKSKSLAFEGFAVPENNGTGELRPQFSSGHPDSIAGLDYYV